ncbi:hypothetical protein DL768_004136 [Monosporascus sp. mg162]|nr:hypothetical protein DL768_004136 [Monosporascus sp. mg162]
MNPVFRRTAAAYVRAVRAERAAAASAEPADAAAAAAVAAAEAAAAAAAAADSAPPMRTPEPAVRAAPETPARPPRQRPAQGVRRAEPYLGYLRSALAGRSNGVCFDAAFFPLLTVNPSLANARPVTVRLVTALESGTPYREVNRFRATAVPAGNPTAVRTQVLAFIRQILNLFLPQQQ